MQQYISNYIEYLNIQRGLAENTLLAYRTDLFSFIDFLYSLNVIDINSVKRIHINMYIKTK